MTQADSSLCAENNLPQEMRCKWQNCDGQDLRHTILIHQSFHWSI